MTNNFIESRIKKKKYVYPQRTASYRGMMTISHDFYSGLKKKHLGQNTQYCNVHTSSMPK